MKPGTTECLPGGTPILDREAPLPGLSAPGPGSRVLLGIFAGLCVGIAAPLMLWHPPLVESLHRWILIQVEELFPGPWTPGRLLFVGLVSILIGFSITAVFYGRRIWMLLRDRARGGRWLALMRLIADARAGVLPESIPAALLARATAVRDDSADTVTAHAFAYSAAFHQHQDGEAAQRLETCLAHSGHGPPVVREALMSDAAVIQARRRKRADLADQWLAAMPPRAQPRWFRSRAEAAILEAKERVNQWGGASS